MQFAFGLDDEKDPKKPEEAKPSEAMEERLFKARSVFIFGQIDMKLANAVTAKMIALAQDGKDEIRVFINSPGGHLESGDTIHDIIKFVDCPVKIIGTGWVGSAAAHIYLSAPKENRLALPNTRFLLHQPSGGAGGQASDIAIQAKEIIKAKARIQKVIAEATGQPLEKVIKDTERDHWMPADEAVEYGVVGRIITSMGAI
ncbi:ATP-dependent Clp protease proteolytic subunit [Elstera cyanobacteriorum]|uniref:ATP-dependent Clp protease proteolytic subunit n=1 Tax=Elstera cyanobacteriorum TaxID=2022747 RepID=A0A255XNX1_9PROT|nr:ATP-dependent Clp protease proteolytic subunit [Elstera cyanobacteriorum]MCK6442024.1 ATP-dependent Clp protease proteolytic subunit [Elstera cyanobacteriorum]OYQ18659.1 ATP-dependent Clp protease proteolytic subunit [Elstera cyanobacteriorum]GFZ78604.1 ATP-dependent Clp protease proteolytic subunit [Elstera cyanobacteriorum]